MPHYIKIGSWYYPITGIVIHISGETVEIFQLGSTKLLDTYQGEQAERIKEWLVARAEDVTVDQT